MSSSNYRSQAPLFELVPGYLPEGMWRARDYLAIPAISMYKAAALSERLVQQQPTFLYPSCAIVHQLPLNTRYLAHQAFY